MKKTQAAQVYFPVSLYFQIKQVAEDEGQPVATWIRELVEKELKRKARGKMRFSDLPTYSLKDVEPDLSERIDEVLYDSP